MRPLAVVDVETTGLFVHRHDRVVEIAAVLMFPGHGISTELSTLVNPGRDVGPTNKHGLMASDIVNAPCFADIAGHLADLLQGAGILAGHNVRFDADFLQSEYMRIGIAMPLYERLDTMHIAGGGTLSACCEKYGVNYDECAHVALHDARAAACLLEKMLLQDPRLLAQCQSCEAPVWPAFQGGRGNLVHRGDFGRANVPVPNYVQRLARKLSIGSANASQSAGERDYRALLWRILEDGRMEQAEADSLVEVAAHWGLSFERIRAIHQDYLSHLMKAVRADGRITDAERREIQVAAQLLGFGMLSDKQFQYLLRACEGFVTAKTPETSTENWRGKAVCFTGESCCSIRGQIISREMAERLATDNKLTVLSSVTKQLDLLVVSNPNTQSGKAKKAKKYGVRIIHESIFWRSLGVQID